MASVETSTHVGLVSTLRSTSSGLGNWQQIFRTAIAVTLAFVFSSKISPGQTAVLAPMTAMFVVQSSAFATVGQTIQRILGTTLGVIVASAYVALLGDSIPAYAGGVVTALVLARVMPVSDSVRIQVVLSMLFVLATGQDEWTSDVGRVIDTAVGGFIGMTAVLIYPPKPDLAKPRAAFAQWYEAVALQLDAMARGTGERPIPRGERHAFVAQSFGLREKDLQARQAFVDAVESMRFNPRAHAEANEQLGLLERDLRWITSVTVQVRALSGEVDRLYDRPGGLPPALPPETLAGLLTSVARLLRAEVHPGVQRATIERRARRIQGRIAEATGYVTLGQRRVSDVLQSLTLLGRLDSLARTVHGGPARLATLPWDETDSVDARKPLPAPTGMMPTVAPEDDPIMTISIPAMDLPPDRPLP